MFRSSAVIQVLIQVLGGHEAMVVMLTAMMSRLPCFRLAGVCRQLRRSKLEWFS